MQLPWRVSIKSCRYHVCRWPGTISGPCSALLEPDPNSKTDPTLNPVKARLCWDRRGILADPISGTAVLEYGPTEILPPVGAISTYPARLCRPGGQASRAHPRGKPGFSTFESGCGRETDSPLEGDGFEPSVPAKFFGCPVDPPAIHLPQYKPAPSRQGPMVRIHLPPAKSLLRT